VTLSARTATLPQVQGRRTGTQRASFAAAREVAERSAMVSARTVKFFADGVIEAGTAAMLAPYTDRPHSCGLPVWDKDELAAAAAAFDADGFRLHIHAIGDQHLEVPAARTHHDTECEMRSRIGHGFRPTV